MEVAEGKLGLRPYGNTYLAELVEAETQTSGGIIIPDTARRETGEAVLLAAGYGERDENGCLVNIPDDRLVGRHVLIGKYMGVDVKWTDGGGNTRVGIIIKPSEIMAIIED